MTPASLEIKDLAFAYPDGNQALFGVNLTIAQVSASRSLVQMARAKQLLSCI